MSCQLQCLSTRCDAIGPGCGKLPGCDAQLLPWNEVAADLIGSWKISTDGRELEFKALTCIDPVPDLVKLTRSAEQDSSQSRALGSPDVPGRCAASKTMEVSS
jgi:hypothetical protein